MCILQLARLGVTEDAAGFTPHAELLGAEQRKEWRAHRAFVALFVASHRGHAETVEFLLRHGNVLGQNGSLAVTAQRNNLPPLDFSPNDLARFVFGVENVFGTSVLNGRS